LRAHWSLWAAIGILILLTPVGLIAAGPAWGEWTTGEMKEQIGFVPGGLNVLANLWQAPLPDYAAGGLQSAVAYILSALVGVMLTAGIAWVLTKWLASREQAAED
jgi:PDGLE domain